MFKRFLSHYLIFLVSLFAGAAALADGGQMYYTYSFLNPAAMMLTKHQKISGGLALAVPRVNFKGTVTPGIAFPSPLNTIAAATFSRTGTTDSRTTYYLPGVEWYQRLNPSTVIGFVYSTPYFTDLNFNQFTTAQYSTYLSRVRSADLSPRISFQIGDKAAIGVGFNATWLSVQLDQYLLRPVTLPAPPFFGFATNQFINKVQAWGYGWNIGFFYHPFRGTFLDVVYYSRESHNLKGNSNLVGVNQTFDLNTHLPRPQTVVIRGFQALSKPFGLIGSFYWAKWNTLQQAIVNGLAVPGVSSTTLPFLYRNAWRLNWGGRWAPNDTWTIILLGAYATTPTVPIARNLTLPESNSWGIIGRLEYNFNKNWQIIGFYNHRWFMKAPMVSAPLGTLVAGQAQPYSDAGGLELTYRA